MGIYEDQYEFEMEKPQEIIPIDDNDNVCRSTREDDCMEECNDNGGGQYAAELPPELWLQVFSLLDRGDFPNLLRVNKRFNELGSERRLWRNLHINVPAFMTNLKTNIKQVASMLWLRSLSMTGTQEKNGTPIPEEFFIALATCNKRLKTLKMRNCILNLKFLNHLAKGCLLLDRLELEACRLMGGGLQLTAFKNLMTFNMVDCLSPRQGR